LKAGALWEAAVSNTYTPKKWAELGKPTVVQNARKRADDILDAHRPRPLDPTAVKNMEEIIRKFERESEKEH
jgi:trimethylamine:corrinoid methyltransferase-like protein